MQASASCSRCRGQLRLCARQGRRRHRDVVATMDSSPSYPNAPVLLQRRALAALCGVLFLTFLDTTIVAVALGSVQSDLQVGVVSLQWVVSAYALVFASLMLPAGTIADRWGRK